MNILFPFINWGQFTSQDPKNPDVLNLQVAEPEIFTTQYSDNVKVYQKDVDGQWKECVLNIKSHESKNFSLLNQWKKAFDKGYVYVNKHFRIKTWLDRSKRNNDRKIRRFKLEV